MGKVEVGGGTDVIIAPNTTTLLSTEPSVEIVTVGTQGPQGIDGADGADGAAGPEGPPGAGSIEWLLGTGVPSNGLGVDTNYYVDNGTEEIYRKITGSWVLTGDFNTTDGGFF